MVPSTGVRNREAEYKRRADRARSAAALAALSPEEDAARLRLQAEKKAARRALLRASAAGAAASPIDDQVLLPDDAIAMDEADDAVEPRHQGGAGPSRPAPSTVAGGEKKTLVVLFPARAHSFFMPNPSNADDGPPSSALPSLQTTIRWTMTPATR